LSKEHLDKARAALAAAKVEVEELTDLVQTGEECGNAPSPVRSFVDSAGATLSKAATAVKDGAKKLYDKVNITFPLSSQILFRASYLRTSIIQHPRTDHIVCFINFFYQNLLFQMANGRSVKSRTST